MIIVERRKELPQDQPDHWNICKDDDPQGIHPLVTVWTNADDAEDIREFLEMM